MILGVESITMSNDEHVVCNCYVVQFSNNKWNLYYGYDDTLSMTFPKHVLPKDGGRYLKSYDRTIR